MKFTSVIALAAISGTDALPGVRKVPPRTPSQRLETLKRFADEYINANVATVRPGARLTKNLKITQKQYDAMKGNYEKLRPNNSGLRRCSFYSDQVPNGGPRPVSATNTRAAVPWIAKELCDLGDLDQCLDSDNRKRRQVTDPNDPDFDPFDAYEAELQDARSNAAVRLSNDPALALRQLRTGYAKWVLRYIAECNGQRLYGAHVKRARKMTNAIQSVLADAVGTYGPGAPQELDWDNVRWAEQDRWFADSEAKPNREKETEA